MEETWGADELHQRQLHGQKGRGHFKAFALGSAVDWKRPTNATGRCLATRSLSLSMRSAALASATKHLPKVGHQSASPPLLATSRATQKTRRIPRPETGPHIEETSHVRLQRRRAPDLRNAWIIRIGQWLRIEAIKFPHTVIGGFEHAPKAQAELSK